MFLRRCGWLILVLFPVMNLRAELVHQWKFNGLGTDEIGPAHGNTTGGAEIDDGRLFVDGVAGSKFLTAPIGNELNEKTLVSWVSLVDATNSTKGSALAIENNPAGDIFDAIVYGEVMPETWMAGSNFFVRTQNPQEFGDLEEVEDPGEVMISIAYAADNSISIYRDTELYGSYAKGTLQPFDANSVVQIGPRHGDHPDVFEGYINEARIYDTALTLADVESIFTVGPDPTPSREPPPPDAPELRHQWTFNGNALDTEGGANGQLFGGAEISCGNAECTDGRLFVDGIAGSRMLTSELGDSLHSKTLVSWISLTDASNSSKGSALTIENDPNGAIFDGIVYGEVNPETWMAGSNGFVRTQNPQEFGEPETVEDPGEVMISIVYDTDNSITLYRDGEEYGSYTKGTLQPYDENAVVQIGPRHGNHPDVFEGFVNEARVYSGALSQEAIQGLFTEGPSNVANPEEPPPPPKPPTVMVHQWTFDGTLEDQVGSAHGELFNDASLTDDGRLELEAANNDYFETETIDNDIAEKTLIAWVSLNDLDSPIAGSVLTIQEAEGPDVFDGIIYAERTARQWMAGSNNFARTPVEDNGGEEESVTAPGEVMIAITYDELGNLTIYRDGEEYAQYATGSPPTYGGGSANVLIGPRHEDRIAAGGPDHFFDGFINEARIYSGVLSVEDISNVFELGLGVVVDFDGNGSITGRDIDILSDAVREGSDRPRYDLNDDGSIDGSDRVVMVEDVLNTYFGDSNLDGEFNTADLVLIFQAGEYEDDLEGNSIWATGDWNGDREFNTGDLVAAFQAGGFEQGPRGSVPVPEPIGTSAISLISLCGIWIARRSSKRHR